jgi:hypothetical protein
MSEDVYLSAPRYRHGKLRENMPSNTAMPGHYDGSDLIVNLHDYSMSSDDSGNVMVIANGPYCGLASR